jgi:hypothetical protein
MGKLSHGQLLFTFIVQQEQPPRQQMQLWWAQLVFRIANLVLPLAVIPTLQLLLAR